MGFFFIPLDQVALLFVPWQAAVAASIAYGIVRR
jgi:hypothetical protein